MKKLFLLLLTAGTISAAQAQERIMNRGIINHSEGDGITTPAVANTGFGIKAGAQFSNFRGDGKAQFPGLSSAASWMAGFYSQFGMGRVFSIQPEILYSRRQGKADAGDIRFDYLEVPVLGVFSFTENVSLHAGPQVGVMMSAKEEGNEINTKDFNSFDYGAAVGAEAKVSIFRLGARYYLSLTDIGKYEDVAPATSRGYNDLKTGNFQLYVGVGF